MRIWHFHYYPPLSGGGLARYVLDFLRIFDAIDQRIVFCRSKDKFADDQANLHVLPPGLMPLSDFKLELLQKDDLVLFHVTHTPHASWRKFSDIASARVARAIFVLHTDLEHSKFNSLQVWPDQLRLKFVDRAYTCSAESARIIVFTEYQKSQLAYLSSVTASVVPMPIYCDFEDSYESKTATDKLLILGERNLIKGYDRFIKFAALSPDLTFLSVGSGDITCRSLPNGRVQEIETLPYHASLRILRDSRALLVFSRTESWGRTILEAYLFQKPVIAFEPVGVLRQVPKEWTAYVAGSNKCGITGMSEHALAGIVSELKRTSTERRIWALQRNAEHQALWSHIIANMG
jgi:glycosyltransferase involved in cell wall biosynthesis